VDTPLKYAGTNSIIAGFAFHDTTCDAVRTVRGPTHRMKTVPEPLFSGDLFVADNHDGVGLGCLKAGVGGSACSEDRRYRSGSVTIPCRSCAAGG